ncbi:hypothetical protein KC845_01320 [Candidatus Kaiserbacteria bacterium]|nr:hypothetical protein [Candidatus Kaiserbacteria bacterium]
MPIKKPATKKVAKKTAKKVVAKKTIGKKVAKKVTKKVAKKSVAKKTKSKTRVLVCASPDNCFWTTDGQILQDLNELQIALSAMEEAVFNYHVQADKNDFANWVEAVLDDADCAFELRSATAPNEARSIVVRHLRTYNF